MKPLQTALQQIFRTHNLNDVSLHDVEAYAAAHPYFSVAHLALVEKKKDEASLQKAALYFNNPFWLQGLLQPAVTAFPHVAYRREPEYSKMYPEVDAIVDVPNESAAEMETIATPAIVDDFAQTEDVLLNDDGDIKDIELSEKAVEDMVEHDDHFEHTIHSEIVETPVHDVMDEHVDGEIVDLEMSEKAIEDLVEHDAHFEHKPIEEAVAEVDVANFSAEKEIPFVYSANVVELSEMNEVANEETKEEETAQTNFHEPEIENVVSANEELPVETIEKEHESFKTKHAEPIDFETIEEQMPDLKSNSLAAAAEVLKRETLMSEEIETEAFHTIDYFASQGIKLLESEQKGKLSSQLKSFTGWLRSMKKFGKDPVITGDEDKEKEIERIAEQANVSKDILTEAMAVVLEKQGKYAKSIDLYQKLSLLNPNKSPYFAAKINRLKTFL